MGVTYATACWEYDWQALLTTGYLEENIRFNEYPFEKRELWINNVDDYRVVARAAQVLVDRGVLTAYHRVADHVDEALRRFRLSLADDSLGRGWVYSVGPLCALHRCDTEWLLYFTGDAKLVAPAPGWIGQTQDFLAANPQCVVGNLMWGRSRVRPDWELLDRESHWQDETFAVGYGFSEQCCLVRADVFRNIDYNTTHPLADKRYKAERLPGTSFEKRVEAWKLNNNLHRVTYKKAIYVHRAELWHQIKRVQRARASGATAT
jgi:hypothetical protein